MQWLRNLYARHLNADKPGAFGNNVGACMTIALYLSFNLWALLVILGRIVFYEFFLLGRGLRWYLPMLFVIILYRLIDRHGIKERLSYIASLDSAQRKQFRRRTGIFYTVSFDIIIIAIIVSPYIRPSHDRVLAAYYGDSEYRRYAAVYEMGDSRDTFYIKYLMHEIDDRRIALTANAKGSCMISAKTSALSKITGDSMSLSYSCPPDTSREIVVNYWKLKYPQYYVPYKREWSIQ